MNSIFTHSLIITLSVLFYLPALWARFTFSANKFSPGIFAIVVGYNMLFGIVHQIFLEEGTLPFIGAIDNSNIGWLSCLFLIAHAEAVPFPWTRKRWFFMKKFSQTP
ncbi:hypothetical protein [Pseudomonas sp.]|uniref:hypothetical protein n=1 Tax=Pseudomonas sp. TaxID=306 RepID=UPI002613F358|nr:hypothetical protein [Pseudomonas sp.]